MVDHHLINLLVGVEIIEFITASEQGRPAPLQIRVSQKSQKIKKAPLPKRMRGVAVGVGYGFCVCWNALKLAFVWYLFGIWRLGRHRFRAKKKPLILQQYQRLAFGCGDRI